MNQEAVFNHFSKIIDNMLDNSLFFETFWQRPYAEETINGSVDDPAIPENINLYFGVSRGCIYDEDYNYVVKFDIEGDYYNDSLCDREIIIYRAAKAQNLDAYFTEPVFLGVYHKVINFYHIDTIEQHLDWYDYDPKSFDENFAKAEDNFGEIIPITIEIPLYAYPRADRYVYSNLTEEEDKIYKTQANSINSPLKKRHLQIAMEFIFRYGMDQYKKISNFMDEYNINDLHFGNIGELNGNLVCIDFAGYHSEYSLHSSSY